MTARGGTWYPPSPHQPSSSVGTIDVVIPALNEELSLPLVLRAIPSEWVRKVVVVDNGSDDRTADVARAHDAHVVHEPRRGYGQACLSGLAELAKDPPDIVVFMDADYSDHPDELPRVVGPLIDGAAELCIGSRTIGEREAGALLPQAIFGNWLATTLIWGLFGYRFTDLGPFRAITWSALEQIAMEDTNFGWTVEMQLKVAMAELDAVEVPVSYRRRVGVSKISGTVTGSVRAGYKILYTIARYAQLAD